MGKHKQLFFLISSMHPQIRAIFTLTFVGGFLLAFVLANASQPASRSFRSLHGDDDDCEWEVCLNKTFFEQPVCPGCAWPCLRDSLTVHEAIVIEFHRLNFEGKFAEMVGLLDPAIELRVPGFGVVLHGVQEVAGYLILSDPNVSDSYIILQSELRNLIQQRFEIMTELHQVFQSAQDPSIVINPYETWRIEFSNRRLISNWTLGVDSQLISSSLGGSLDQNITSVCTNIQQDCQAGNQQYASVQDCINFMVSIPFVGPNGFSDIFAQYSFLCRSFHELLARSLPDIHCHHVGPNTVVSPFVTPCGNWYGTAKRAARHTTLRNQVEDIPLKELVSDVGKTFLDYLEEESTN